MEPKNKTETSVKYDDRKKEMVQDFKSTTEIKMEEEVVGESIVQRKATFNKEGIRKVLKDLSNQRTKLEQSIKQVKDNLKDVKKLTKAEVELEKQIQNINTFNKSDQMKLQIEGQEAELKIIKGDIQDIKNAVGGRIKL